jgi:hypothetical protein
VVEHALGRCARALAATVGKQLAPPDGTVIEVRLSGPMARTYSVTMSGGRARVETAASTGRGGDATVTLTADQETFWCVGGGRWSPDAVLADRRVLVNGDQVLGERLVRALPFMV